MPVVESKYGYTVGQLVQTKYELKDENDNTIPAGTQIRIVAITPKVRVFPAELIKLWEDSYLYDTQEYFYNAVIASQAEDYGNRIRENFCTIEKITDLTR